MTVMDPTFERDALDLQLLRAWAIELGTGGRSQGRERLRTVAPDGSHWCCLGVLCDLVNPCGWIGLNEWAFYDRAFSVDLPMEIAARVGLSPNGARLDGERWDFGGDLIYESLASANDNGIGFPAIGEHLLLYAAKLEGERE